VKIRFIALTVFSAAAALLAIKLNIIPRTVRGVDKGSRERVMERPKNGPDSLRPVSLGRELDQSESPATAVGPQAGTTMIAWDFNGNGYVGLEDYAQLDICWADSGPNGVGASPDCLAVFDSDADGNIDLADFAAFQRASGHLPIPLRDTLSNVIAIDSTTPYSGRKTCGANGCHDVARITNGLKFQQGRTDVKGNVIVREDYYGDGRWWMRSPGRYGMVTHDGAHAKLTAKQALNESEVDNSTFNWISGCGGCHPGGGPGEFDRDGQRLYDAATGKFGWQVSGADPALHGDYIVQNTTTGAITQARWDLTGLAEADCLFCHTPDPNWNDTGQNINRRNWRPAILAGSTDLVDNQGNHVPAFAAASPGAQGWFSKLQMSGSKATVLQIDYRVGVAAGTLIETPDHLAALPAKSLDRKPRDNACWMCHTAQMRQYHGEPWFDQRIIHYAKFNNLRDTDPANDIAGKYSRTCVYCHPGNLDHNIAKGNSMSKHFRDELDYVNVKTCRGCHLTVLPDGQPNPNKHPDAPGLPGALSIHLLGFFEGDNGPMRVMSCQACHIPYSVYPATQVMHFGDRFVGGMTSYNMDRFYSADPLNPSSPDKSTFYPALIYKTDSDGVSRLFPGKGPVMETYWGDWDQRGTPDDRRDDLIVPITRWRFTQRIGNQPLPIVTDDNGDGKPEVNRPEELLAYMQALKGNDIYGRQVAANPVLVRGWRVWYEDPQAPEGVNSFNPDDYGIRVHSMTYREMTHGVLAAKEAWGYDDPADPNDGCRDCHRPDTLDSPVFDRKILMDPWGPDGQPVYTTVRAMTGLNPP